MNYLTHRVWPNDCRCGKRMRFAFTANGTARRECSGKGGCGSVVHANETAFVKRRR